jgi:CubicO group peptidase (beta-lactamase class C family)
VPGALQQIETWPVDVAAAGVSGPKGPVAMAGPASRPFRWASVTKLLTALATLVAVEEGTVGLEDPAGPPGATVRHLLAHASGLPMDGGPGPSPIARPGIRRIYSNLGFEVLAQTIADRAGMTFGEYLRAAVLEPLDLAHTTVEGSPASGAVGSLEDLLGLGQQLLTPTVVAAETLAEATRVQFPGLAGVLPGFGRQDPNDWGLGFELRDHKSPHWTGGANSPRTFGHFGQSGAMLWVDPVVGLACGSLAERPFGPWAADAWPRLSDAVLSEYGR